MLTRKCQAGLRMHNRLEFQAQGQDYRLWGTYRVNQLVWLYRCATESGRVIRLCMLSPSLFFVTIESCTMEKTVSNERDANLFLVCIDFKKWRPLLDLFKSNSVSSASSFLFNGATVTKRLWIFISFSHLYVLERDLTPYCLCVGCFNELLTDWCFLEVTIRFSHPSKLFC